MNVTLIAAEGGTVTFQPNAWGLLIGLVLPIAVGLVTKVTTNESVKATLLLLLTALNGFLTEFVNAQVSGESYDMATALYTWAGSFVLGVATHFGLLKPVGVSGWAQRNMMK